MEPLRIATCRELPEPDPDEALLLAALEARGVAARMAAWDDPAEDWDAAIPTVVRSTWNYHRAPGAFAAWIDRASAHAPMWNAPGVLHGNLHKRYLLSLASAGIPVVPTELLPRGSEASLRGVLRSRGWTDVVVKPAVSCASFATVRVREGDLDAGEEHLGSLLPERDVLVQPYLPSVDGHGERAVVVIDGEITHAVRKVPRLMGQDESVSGVAGVEPEERRLAERAVAQHGGNLLYARVDMARDASGQPVLMELELMEPSLFLAHEPRALHRLADGIARRLRRP